MMEGGEEGRILNIERRGKKGRKEKTWKNHEKQTLSLAKSTDIYERTE